MIETDSSYLYNRKQTNKQKKPEKEVGLYENQQSSKFMKL